MSFEFQEALWFLLTGQGLLIVAVLVIAGFFIGGTFRVVGITLWSAPVLIAGFVMFTSGEYFRTIDLIHRTGSGGFSAGLLSMIILVLLLALYVLAVWFGIASRRAAAQKAADDASSMSPDDFLRIINAAAAHPVLGQGGWLATRWTAMDTPERRRWVDGNLQALRDLEARTEGSGIESLGVDLPSMLAVIDQNAPRAHRNTR